MRPLVRCLSLGTLLLLLTAGSVAAQATAQLSGTVRDESGAALPGVTVTVTQTDTGLARTTATNDTGSYVLPNLPTGPYRLEVSLTGFRTYEQTGIVLQVAASPVINAVLAVGSVEETVSVDAAAALVDVRSAGISAVVENERIVELPLQGRQVTDLLVLAGAAVQTAIPQRGVPGGVSISVAGGLPFGVAYLLDGATHNNPQTNANLPLPFPDALQEFRVATSGLSAENGMHSGASVNAVTRASRGSGLRGSLVIIEQAAEPGATANSAVPPRGRGAFDKPVPQTLMIPFAVIVDDEFGDGPVGSAARRAESAGRDILL